MYRPLQVFSKTSLSPDSVNSCLVILNQKLNGLESVIKEHWNKFSVHVCADGGSNRLYDNISDTERDKYIPHTICGDLDSARDEVLEYYKERGSRILTVSEQDNTDFTKTVNEVLELRQKGIVDFSAIYAMNAMGGRFDQTLGNVQTIMTLSNKLQNVPLYLVSEDSIAMMLNKGESVIMADSGLEKGYCGLLPIGEHCTNCTTTGLQWNLCDEEMRFGGLVSTSNLLSDGHLPVHVKTTSPLLWTMSHTLCQ